MEIFHTVAKEGNLDGYVRLGTCYAEGIGGSTNAIEAANCFKVAAERGSARARLKLGECYAKGFGVPQNITEARRWVDAAAAQGDKEAIKFSERFLSDSP